jgi:hypothetical protein
LYLLKKKGNVPKVSSKNLVEPLKPWGRCASIPKKMRRYLFSFFFPLSLVHKRGKGVQAKGVRGGRGFAGL